MKYYQHIFVIVTITATKSPGNYITPPGVNIGMKGLHLLVFVLWEEASQWPHYTHVISFLFLQLKCQQL